jgi:hypothetical protein
MEEKRRSNSECDDENLEEAKYSEKEMDDVKPAAGGKLPFSHSSIYILDDPLFGLNLSRPAKILGRT